MARVRSAKKGVDPIQKAHHHYILVGVIRSDLNPQLVDAGLKLHFSKHGHNTVTARNHSGLQVLEKSMQAMGLEERDFLGGGGHHEAAVVV